MDARDVGGAKRAAAPGPEEETGLAGNEEAVFEFVLADSVHPDEVRRAVVDEIAGLAARHGWTERVAYRVQLVLDELATNVASYGRSQGTTSHLDIRIAREGDTVRIDMMDDGAPFDPLTEAPPVPVHGLDRPVAVGGLGLHLVRQMTRTMAYRYEGGRNHLRLTIGIE